MVPTSYYSQLKNIKETELIKMIDETITDSSYKYCNLFLEQEEQTFKTILKWTYRFVFVVLFISILFLMRV